MDFNYKTNASEFDFNEYKGLPTIRYVLATSPRCGSNMLQRILWRTKSAGAPEEYITTRYIEDYSKRWPGIIDENGDLNFSEYTRCLYRHRTSDNGVFGIKFHGGHLHSLMEKNQDLHQLMQGPDYIWIKRKDKIYQAISYDLANQTGVWIIDGKWLPLTESNPKTPKFNKAKISECLKLILEDEKVWQDYFTRKKINPKIIYYEDLVIDYIKVVKACMNRLGITFKNNGIPSPGIKKQRSKLNDEWAERYYRFLIESSNI